MNKNESKKNQKRVLGRMVAQEISAEELKQAMGGLLADAADGSTGSCCCDCCSC
jgi:hypothetical protein